MNSSSPYSKVKSPICQNISNTYRRNSSQVSIISHKKSLMTLSIFFAPNKKTSIFEIQKRKSCANIPPIHGLTMTFLLILFSTLRYFLSFNFSKECKFLKLTIGWNDFLSSSSSSFLLSTFFFFTFFYKKKENWDKNYLKQLNKILANINVK